MSFINPHVEINGSTAQLATFTDSFACIHVEDETCIQGEEFKFTIFVNLMGKQVPVKLCGQVVQRHDGAIDVMFKAPTNNWNRLIRVMLRRECLM
ncbi:hypothetical protein [Magnetovibrio sp.]|uniref:hypothetical protein n=1 Tax=Magnetovibrio sp. TaxID=2024836 RepID=UPI002F94376C